MGQKPKKSHQSEGVRAGPAARPNVMGVLCVGGGGVKGGGGRSEVFFGPSSYPVTTEV